MEKKHIAIFASGSGSNARKIMEYFKEREDIVVRRVVTNKSNPGVLNHTKEFHIPYFRMNRSFFQDHDYILDVLKFDRIDLIVLAGFLWLIPPYLLKAYSNKIINIHPSLLPKYGGKGMYGHHVHEAVYANQESESGITIHYVNEQFDEGKHIFQASCPIEAGDDPKEIARKVLKLEHENYARVIDDLLK